MEIKINHGIVRGGLDPAQTSTRKGTIDKAASIRNVDSVAVKSDSTAATANATGSATTAAPLAIPPRSKWDSMWASVGLESEWVPVSEISSELRGAITIQTKATPKEAQALTLETLSTMTRLGTEVPEIKVPGLVRVADDQLEVDRYALLRALVAGEPGTESDRDAAANRSRTMTSEARAVSSSSPTPTEAEATPHLESSAQGGHTSSGGDGRRDNDGSQEEPEPESDEAIPPVTIRGTDAFELVPASPTDLNTALKQVDIGTSSGLRRSVSGLLAGEAETDTVHLSTYYSVSIPEVEALLSSIQSDAEAIGADRLSFRSKETLDAIRAVMETDDFIDQINSGSIPIEQLLMMVMIRVSEGSDTELRNKMEEVMLAEQEEAQRSAREGLAEVGSAVFDAELVTTLFDQADQELSTGTKSSAVLMQELQHLTHQWQQTNELISNLSKSLHDMAMTPIRNLR